jgi:ectoine hydroxylase-related dioxygenase (phytanoyl-CoA dioxygenase family)
MISKEQIAQFHADGFLILRGMFQGEELEELRHAADAVQAEGMAGEGQHHLYRDKADGSKTYHRSEQMWDRGDIFRAVTVKPDLLACIGQCSGHPFMPFNDSFVCKIPRGDVPVPWHQDPPYARPEGDAETFEIPNFDVDIYLDESSLENGCVWGIPGHHLVGHVEVENFTQHQLFNDLGAVPMEMQPGDVLFHCISAPHGSIGNVTDSVRRIFYIHYTPREVYEQCYPQWHDIKLAYAADRFALVRDMLAIRRNCGWDGIDDTCVTYTDGVGFEFVGEPGTQPRHWGTLIAAMSAGEIQQKKILAQS